MLRRHGYRRLSSLAFALACMCPCARASAQTLKEELQQHMRENVEKSEEEARRRREAEEQKQKQAQQRARPKSPEQKSEPAPAPASPAKGEPEGGLHFSFDSRDTQEPAKKPEGPELPVRVFGDNFKLDITFGVGYRGWLPQPYQAVSVEVGNYATWNIDLRAKIFGVILRRGYYESNGVAAPRTQEAAVAVQVGGYARKAMRALGILGIPISKAWEPQIRYESYGFETTAKPNKNVCVVDRSASGNAQGCPGTMGDLKIVSGFETLVAGVRYDHSKSGSAVVGPRTRDKIPPIFFGVGLMQYRKPYQVNVNGVALDDYLFDSRFRGIGLALGTELGGGIDSFFAEIDAQLGAGEVSLSDKLTLNQVIPSGYTIGYLQGTATLGYRLALIHAAPTLILVPVIAVGGADFFLVATNNDSKDAPSPSVNWDFLWTAQISLLLPL